MIVLMTTHALRASVAHLMETVPPPCFALRQTMGEEELEALFDRLASIRMAANAAEYECARMWRSHCRTQPRERVESHDD